MYVVNGKSPTGPNPGSCLGLTPEKDAKCRATNQYNLQLIKAGLQSFPTPTLGELQALTQQVASNDSFKATLSASDTAKLAFLRAHIKHVIYIVKENRTYDQILGDLEVGNGEPKLAMFPEPVTPNLHRLARRFVTLDNFYDTAEVSGNGWNWSTAARATDVVEKTVPVNYASRGGTYDWEGANRNIIPGFPLNDPNLLPGTADVSAPDGPNGEGGAGYLWDGALRANLAIRNYGF